MEWFEKLYTRRFIDLCGFANPEQTKREAQFVVDLLDLHSGSRILDLCCGYGRHTFEIARMGKCEVIGFDLSEDFLSIAEKKYAAPNIQYTKGDMRDIRYKNHFDAVVNLFTSFGFFQNDKENELVIQQVKNALKPGGLFLLDYENKFFFVYNDVYQREHYWKKSADGLCFLIENCYDVMHEREKYTVDIIKDGETIDRVGYDIRLYSLPELRRMLHENGFEILEVWGDFTKEEYSVKSRRLITLSRKMEDGE